VCITNCQGNSVTLYLAAFFPVAAAEVWELLKVLNTIINQKHIAHRTELWPQESCTKITVKFGHMVIEICEATINTTDSQTHTDSDIILMPAGFHRHLEGKTLRNVFHCNLAEIHCVGKLVIVWTFHKPAD